MITKHIIDTKLKTVKKIIHLADIHVRLYKRHGEYTDVFDTLYENLNKRDLTDTIIVIAGDIVHSKTDMSPEMVQVVSGFLTKLSSIVPTIIIPGNHDLNLSNPNRLDALSPIIENLNLDSLHYFRESGIYNFANLQFGVHSIIGSAEEWPTPDDMLDTKPKIALYHAAVNQAQTDAGYKITNRVTVEDFKGYDMVMLGDIHKTQILQEKSIGIPEVAYPGSLIQQNHGELPIGHGYLVWDVSTSKIEEFVEVPNKIGYYTLTLADKTMPPTPNMPENVRLRLFVSDVDDSFVKKAIAVLRKKYNIIECTINRTKNIANAATAQSTLSIIDNMNDVTQQNIHIRTFIQEQFPNTAPDLIDKICEINTTLNGKIGEDELPRNISWKPLMLEFNNLFSYGEGNKINFENMSGLYGVFSPNATGKTSAFDALCFALYDKTPRAFKGSHIMNTRKDEFSCVLTINIENEIFTIERTGSRKKNGEVKVDVNFFKQEGDTQISLNGEDRRDTNAAIRSYVGTYEDFILTTMSVQNQNTLFIETGQSDRKDLLSQFIGLTVFDRLLTLATDEIKEVAGALKSFKKTDFTQKLATVQTDFQRITADHEAALKQAGELKDNISITQNYIDQSRSAIIAVPTDYNDIQHFIAERNKLKDIVTESETVVQSAKDKRDELSKDILVINNELTKLGNRDDLLTAHTKLEEARLALAELRIKLQGLSLEERHVSDKIKNLAKHKYDPNCKFCINNVFVIDAKKAEEMYYKIRDAMIRVEDNIRVGEEFIFTIIEEASKYEQWKGLSQRMLNKEHELISAERTLTAVISQSQSNAHKFNELEILISASEEFKQIAQQNQLYQRKIEEHTINKQKLELELVRVQSSIMEMYGKIEVLRTQREDMLASIKEAEELETTYEAYETYIGVIGRDGLPYKLIGAIIPTLQLEVNNILEQIVDFTVSLDIDGKNINGRIIYDDQRVWPLELASGMERFIGGLAIRIALMSISNLPKSNFLIIDEGLGVLDADNLSSMTMMFDILAQKFEFIILISHLEATRDIAENLIEIKRNDGYSTIVVE